MSEFFEYIKGLLKDDFQLYLNSLKEPLKRGININTLKIEADKLFEMDDFKVEKSVFSSNSYILTDDKSYGNSLSHIMGLIYIQEPSASAVIDILNPLENEKILDMCASPGGKTIQIGIRMRNKGLLVSNEYDFLRSKTLLSNVERMGLRNCIVTNSDTYNLVKGFECFFDKILVDAPCSGEGMFKKYPDSIKEWSINNVYACAKRQIEILNNAYFALKNDGILVYSTCTINTIENEGVVEEFLRLHPDLKLINIEENFGRKGFNNDKVLRIMPYDGGEGQFIAKFKKHGGFVGKGPKIVSSKIDNAVYDFLNEINYEFKYLLNINDRIYGSDYPFLDIKCLRNKVLIGEIVKKRFEPHHNLYTALSKNDFKKYVEIDEKQALAFIQGNILEISGYKGYVAIVYNNHVLGFGKGDSLIIKNKYPKGLRKV